MDSFLLTSETSQMPLAMVLQRAACGGLEIRDDAGNVVALVLSPKDREERLYAEAFADLAAHRDQVQRAASRRDGITTAELLRRARAATGESGP